MSLHMYIYTMTFKYYLCLRRSMLQKSSNVNPSTLVLTATKFGFATLRDGVALSGAETYLVALVDSEDLERLKLWRRHEPSLVALCCDHS